MTQNGRQELPGNLKRLYPGETTTKLINQRASRVQGIMGLLFRQISCYSELSIVKTKQTKNPVLII